MSNDPSLPLASLSAAGRDQALKHFYIIQPFLQGDATLVSISHSANIPLRTLRRWVQQFEAHGLAGLARRNRTLGPASLPEDMRQLIEALALQSSGRTISSIKREVDAIGAERSWPIISYHSFLRITQKLDKALVSLAHEGAKAYSEKFDLIHRREARRPNQIWQSDHSDLDVLLIDDHGQPSRPWLGVILDDYSRSVCGYNLSFEAPAALRTALMLRQAIWRKSEPNWHICGIPDRFYTDNGSDFTSKHMEQVAADIDMKLIFSTKGKPRGRGKMERFFGTVNELFLCHVPGNTITAPYKAKATLTLEEFKKLFHAWLLSDYQCREHSEIETSPMAKWLEAGFLPRIPDSVEQLDLLLLTVARPRQVQPDGIHFQNLRYTSPVLAPYVRESVIIRYDPQDLAEIRVFHNNRFLCRAICTQLESKTISLKELTAARNQRRKHLTKQLHDRKRLIDTYVQSHCALPPLLLDDKEQPSSKLKRYFND